MPSKAQFRKTIIIGQRKFEVMAKRLKDGYSYPISPAIAEAMRWDLLQRRSRDLKESEIEVKKGWITQKDLLIEREEFLDTVKMISRSIVSGKAPKGKKSRIEIQMADPKNGGKFEVREFVYPDSDRFYSTPKNLGWRSLTARGLEKMVGKEKALEIRKKGIRAFKYLNSNGEGQ